MTEEWDDAQVTAEPDDDDEELELDDDDDDDEAWGGTADDGE